MTLTFCKPKGKKQITKGVACMARHLPFQYIWQMRFLPVICFCSLIFAACSIPMNQEKLIGSWDYIKIDNLNSQSEDITTLDELKEAKPYIHFSDKNELQIFWGGKLLSSGTFRIEGKMIRYKEDLQDGGQREFPFLVKSLSESEIVFETMSSVGTRVTAVKRK